MLLMHTTTFAAVKGIVRLRRCLMQKMRQVACTWQTTHVCALQPSSAVAFGAISRLPSCISCANINNAVMTQHRYTSQM